MGGFNSKSEYEKIDENNIYEKLNPEKNLNPDEKIEIERVKKIEEIEIFIFEQFNKSFPDKNSKQLLCVLLLKYNYHIAGLYVIPIKNSKFEYYIKYTDCWQKKCRIDAEYWLGELSVTTEYEYEQLKRNYYILD